MLNFVFEGEKNPKNVVEAKSKADIEHLKAGWLAHELYDSFLAGACTEASNVYALGYLLQVLFDFWKTTQELWMDGTTFDAAIMDVILHKINN